MCFMLFERVPAAHRIIHLININFFSLFPGSVTPMCVVSKALFLTGGGWADLRNRSDTEPPFRLFRDEGRTFLRVSILHIQASDLGISTFYKLKNIMTLKKNIYRHYIKDK